MSDPFTLAQVADATIDIIQSTTPLAFEDHAVRLFQFQILHNPVYAAWCKQTGIDPPSVLCANDIPSLPISAFKQAEVTVLPEAKRSRFFSSSGTSQGIRSRHFFNSTTVAVYEASLSKCFAQYFLEKRGFHQRMPAIISLTPPPLQAPTSSLVHMIHTLGQTFPCCRYAGASNAGSPWTVSWDTLSSMLEAARAQSVPVVLIGTAFGFVHLLDSAMGFVPTLPEGSVIIETGGYKNQSRTLTRTELHTALQTCFGLQPGDIRTEYGMSELSSQAYDSAETPGEFVWPRWVQCRIISPEKGQPAPDGQPGNIEILDLANIGSCLRILTEDMGIMTHGRMILLGRAERAPEKGCSLFQSPT